MFHLKLISHEICFPIFCCWVWNNWWRCWVEREKEKDYFSCNPQDPHNPSHISNRIDCAGCTKRECRLSSFAGNHSRCWYEQCGSHHGRIGFSFGICEKWLEKCFISNSTYWYRTAGVSKQTHANKYEWAKDFRQMAAPWPTLAIKITIIYYIMVFLQKNEWTEENVKN